MMQFGLRVKKWVTRGGGRRRAVVRLALWVTAVVVLANTVVFSGASFTSRSTNPGNVFNGGTLLLLNSEDGQLIVSAPALGPGQSQQATLTLTNAGTVPGDVSVEGVGLSDVPATPALSAVLTLTFTDVGAGVDLWSGTMDSPHRGHPRYTRSRRQPPVPRHRRLPGGRDRSRPAGRADHADAALLGGLAVSRLASWAFTLLTVFAIGVALLLIAIPVLFGYERYVITGGSMEPTIHKGSVAFGKVVPVADLRVGDVHHVRPTRSVCAGHPPHHRRHSGRARAPGLRDPG